MAWWGGQGGGGGNEWRLGKDTGCNGGRGGPLVGGEEDASYTQGEITKNNGVGGIVRAEECCRESAPGRE
jgi:hypothetical protein